MSFVKELLASLDQIRVYHWQTHNYARHIAAGQLYDTLSALTDQLVETWQGKYGRFELKGKIPTYTQLNDAQAVNFLRSLRAFLVNTLPKEFNRQDSDLFNIRDEMLADVEKTLYLFTLQ